MINSWACCNQRRFSVLPAFEVAHGVEGVEHAKADRRPRARHGGQTIAWFWRLASKRLPAQDDPQLGLIDVLAVN